MKTLMEKIRRLRRRVAAEAAPAGEAGSAEVAAEAAPTEGAGSAEVAAEEEARTVRVLFVCMGNICRSPTAAGVFRKAVAAALPGVAIEVDAAGTHAYHVGDAPDPRARRAAIGRGVDLSEWRARRVEVEDFARFDLVLAMDELNRAALHEICPPEHRERVRLFLEFAPQLERLDVPDPYYGGSNGFEHVLDLVEEASAGLVAHLRELLEREEEAGRRARR